VTDSAPVDGIVPPSPLRGGFIRNVVPALVWAVAIFVGGSSGVPQPEIDIGLPSDKVNHIAAFGGLQLLTYRALRYALPTRRPAPLRWVAVVVATLVGVLLELYQLGLPDRSADIEDAIADAVGAMLGAVLLTLLARTWPRPHARGLRDTAPAPKS
jgi:VanZ family protein